MKFSLSHLLLLGAVAAITFSSCRNEANLIPETCFDGIRNQGEIRVDCGGPNCDDCDPTCDDNEYNQDEFSPVSLTNTNVLGIDCGGENCEPCATCDDGIRNAHWVFDPNLTPADMGQDSVGMGPSGVLYRLVMERGIDCGFPCDSVCVPTCTDGILNGQEIGIDCGGPDCPPCVIPPNCFDGIQNGQETGIDCGSAECPLSQQNCPDPTCNDGIMNTHIEVTNAVQEGYIIVVEVGIDCDNNPLTSCPQCPLPTCFDGIMNGNEEGVDCGGPCITACSEIPSCHDGVQNGDETGVDCGGNCPPCPNCSDEFKNGPELFVDCLDYPIPTYARADGTECPLCPSCHDGLLTVSLFELDIDCGGPTCERCEQFLTAGSIGITAAQGTEFTDQFTFNEAVAGFQDTLFVPNALVIAPTQGALSPYRIIRGIQHIDVPGTGIYERVLEIFIPAPVQNLPTGDANALDVGPLPLGPITPPTVRYKEGFISGPFTGQKTYNAIAPVPELNDPDGKLTIEYNYTNLAAGLIRGSINQMRLREATPLNPEMRVVKNIEFSIQYIPQQ